MKLAIGLGIFIALLVASVIANIYFFKITLNTYQCNAKVVEMVDAMGNIVGCTLTR